MDREWSPPARVGPLHVAPEDGMAPLLRLNLPHGALPPPLRQVGLRGLPRGTPGTRAPRHVSLLFANDALSVGGGRLCTEDWDDMSQAGGKICSQTRPVATARGCSPQDSAKTALLPSEADLPDRPFPQGVPKTDSRLYACQLRHELPTKEIYGLARLSQHCPDTAIPSWNCRCRVAATEAPSMAPRISRARGGQAGQSQRLQHEPPGYAVSRRGGICLQHRTAAACPRLRRLASVWLPRCPTTRGPDCQVTEVHMQH